MSLFTTTFNNLAQLDEKIINNDRSNIRELAQAIVRTELGQYADALITSWAEGNTPWIDFFFALKPDWLKHSIDDKQIKMRVSIDTGEHTWYAYLVMDCEDGECEAYGEKEFHPEVLETLSNPVKSMVHIIHEQYNAKLREDANNKDKDLKVAEKVAKRIKTHVDAINKICKENNIQIYTDNALDSCHSHFLVPKSIEPVEAVCDDEIPLDQFPSFDFDGKWFDSSYDAFIRK